LSILEGIEGHFLEDSTLLHFVLFRVENVRNAHLVIVHVECCVLRSTNLIINYVHIFITVQQPKVGYISIEFFTDFMEGM
jgi:hypothetical protein